MPTETKKPNTKTPYFYAVGRRKRAIARVRLYTNPSSDKQEIIVNDKPVQSYFRLPHAQKLYLKPLEITKTMDRFKITVKVEGSGPKGQIGAIVHGVARALVKVDEEFKPLLKHAGLLTRDPRKKQRRMVGTGGKARRQKQSPKR